jgi:glycerol-3-phosphate dehydrogenase
MISISLGDSGSVSVRPKEMENYEATPEEFGGRKAEERSREELLVNLAQVRQNMHSAAQSVTSILTIVELLSQYEVLESPLKEDLDMIFQESLKLKNLFQKIRQITE